MSNNPCVFVSNFAIVFTCFHVCLCLSLHLCLGSCLLLLFLLDYVFAFVVFTWYNLLNYANYIKFKYWILFIDVFTTHMDEISCVYITKLNVLLCYHKYISIGLWAVVGWTRERYECWCTYKTWWKPRQAGANQYFPHNKSHKNYSDSQQHLQYNTIIPNW